MQHLLPGEVERLLPALHPLEHLVVVHRDPDFSRHDVSFSRHSR